jgi:heme/copper-type cytochrome/quinol oxidase subunit 3
MADAVQQPSLAIEQEPPELQERNTWVGARLAVSSTAFLFLPFFFGYLYLASLNSSALWRPDKITAPLGWGLAIMLALIVSAGFVAAARVQLAGGRASSSRWLSLAGLLAGLAAVVLQGLEYARLGFGPADGGFASVFVGWSGLLAVVVLGAMVWLEINVATSFRQRDRLPHSSQSDLDAVGFYLSFLAGLGAVTFLFLYLL